LCTGHDAALKLDEFAEFGWESLGHRASVDRGADKSAQARDGEDFYIAGGVKVFAIMDWEWWRKGRRAA
jgi:hypothetical protein